MGGLLGGNNFFINLFSIYCSDRQREGFLKRFHQSSRRIESSDQRDFKNLKNYFD
jgi:hypothetical protein